MNSKKAVDYIVAFNAIVSQLWFLAILSYLYEKIAHLMPIFFFFFFFFVKASHL